MRGARWFIGFSFVVASCGSSPTPVVVDAGSSTTIDDSQQSEDASDVGGSTPDAPADTSTGSDAASIGPCHPGFAVDGQNGGWQNGAGCGEYAGTGSVTGMNGTYYAASPAVAAMQFFADWTWRSDGDLCGAMFSRARFSTGGGKHHWQVKVFADKHNETLQDGVAWTGSHAASYGFGPSGAQTPAHPQFEFRVDAVPMGQVAILVQGPDKVANLKDDPATQAGCTLPEKALVLEPTVLVAQMSVTGLTSLAPAQGLIAVTVDKPQTAIGEIVTVWGAFFGTTSGTAAVNGVPVQVVDWQPGAVRIQMPIMAAAEGKIVLTTADGQASNPLFVTLVAPPNPAQCQGKNPGTPCNDGLSCTKNDTCKAGQCTGSDTCATSSPCSASTCSAGSDCVETPLASGAPCKGGVCSGFCSATGVCEVDSGVVVCDDGNPCTQELCNAMGCAHSAIADGTPCDDGNVCTDNDLCKSAACGGSAKDCNDNNACTIDNCEAGKGCVYPTACDDGNPCTIDSCQSGKCAVTPLADNTGCDDQNPCTKGDQCSGQKCQGTPIPGCK